MKIIRKIHNQFKVFNDCHNLLLKSQSKLKKMYDFILKWPIRISIDENTSTALFSRSQNALRAARAFALLSRTFT